MAYQWFGKPKSKSPHSPLCKGGLGGICLLLLIFVIACGAAATATPAPPAAKAPAAAPTPTKAPVAAAPAAPAVPAATPVPKAAPTATPAPTPPPKAKVSRLVMGIPPPTHEINRPWLTSGSGLVQHSPMFERLVGADPITGELKPTQLATKWEMSADGKRWTFWLREGIPFHFGWGNFTARDVEHTTQMWTQKEAIQTRTGYLRERVDRFEHVNDHQTVLHLKIPDILMDDIFSEWKGTTLLSKAQWDKEGGTGVEARPAGTGSYRYKERQLGVFIRFERVDNHWRKTPEFAELEMRFVPEASTRLAMLLANEAHVVDVPRELEGQAIARGMKKIRGAQPGLSTVVYMGGLFFATPEKFDPLVPWANPNTGKLVREALNRAINRKELNETIFKGEGEPVRVHDYHPAFAPVNPDWEKRFDEFYGYDPARAKRLLAQAGYPKGFKVKLFSFLQSGFPELPDVAEAMALYFKAIGLDVEIVTADFAVVRDKYRSKDNHQFIFPFRRGAVEVVAGLDVTFKVIFAYEDRFVLDRYDRVAKSIDREERKRLLLEMGDHLFFEYAYMPLFYLPVKVMVNPEVVAGWWNWPGAFAGSYTLVEYIQAAR